MRFDIAYLLRSIVNLMLAVVAILLAVRFIFRLFGANASNGLVDWVYQTTSEILGPFRGIFPATHLEGGFVIEFSTIFALLVYGLIGLLAFYLIDMLSIDTRRETKSRR